MALNAVGKFLFWSTMKVREKHITLRFLLILGIAAAFILFMSSCTHLPLESQSEICLKIEKTHNKMQKFQREFESTIYQPSLAGF